MTLWRYALRAKIGTLMSSCDLGGRHLTGLRPHDLARAIHRSGLISFRFFGPEDVHQLRNAQGRIGRRAAKPRSARGRKCIGGPVKHPGFATS